MVGGGTAAAAKPAWRKACRRPTGYQRHPARVAVRVPVAGLPLGLRAAHDDLQPLEPLERAGHLDAAVRGAGERGACRRGDDRQFCRQGAAGLRWWKGGPAAQAIGRSRGGRTTKVHAVCDGIGRLRAFLLSPGNIADITVAPDLIASAPVGKTFIADKRAMTPRRCEIALLRVAPASSFPTMQPGVGPIRSMPSPTATATSSSACSARSRTGDALPPATISSPETSPQPSPSSPPSPGGFD